MGAGGGEREKEENLIFLETPSRNLPSWTPALNLVALSLCGCTC